ncbi:hypothetical protein NPIL_448341 [Nephila pilipes]|uniref:Uncharacterized protein n=1 Tax=Nephila pilipes TaxID=299642 RepID=A0A8X6JPS7_NEPPI|nr:hypothetical protein NPIL_448341 [Nephila pilipes]
MPHDLLNSSFHRCDNGEETNLFLDSIVRRNVPRGECSFCVRASGTKGMFGNTILRNVPDKSATSKESTNIIYKIKEILQQRCKNSMTVSISAAKLAAH